MAQLSQVFGSSRHRDLRFLDISVHLLIETVERAAQRAVVGELFAEGFPEDNPLRRAFDRFDQEVNRYIEKAKVPVAA